jgi:hypothetical protein
MRWLRRDGLSPSNEAPPSQSRTTNLLPSRFLSLKAFGRRPRCKPHRRHGPASETLNIFDGSSRFWLPVDFRLAPKADLRHVRSFASVPQAPRSKTSIEYDREAYKRRNLLERCVNRLKQFRRIGVHLLAEEP